MEVCSEAIDRSKSKRILESLKDFNIFRRC